MRHTAAMWWRCKVAIYTSGVDQEELHKLIASLTACVDKAMPKIKQASDAAGEIVLREIRSRAPVRSGTLRDSLKLQKKKPVKSDYTYCVIAFPKATAYAVPVELGHDLVKVNKSNKRSFKRKIVGHIAETRFMRDGAEAAASAVSDKIIAALNDVIESLGDHA